MTGSRRFLRNRIRFRSRRLCNSSTWTSISCLVFSGEDYTICAFQSIDIFCCLSLLLALDFRQTEWTRLLTIRSDWTLSLQSEYIRRALAELWLHINAAKSWRVYSCLPRLLAAIETWHIPRSRPWTMESDWTGSLQSGCIRRALAELRAHINAATLWRVYCRPPSVLGCGRDLTPPGNLLNNRKRLGMGPTIRMH